MVSTDSCRATCIMVGSTHIRSGLHVFCQEDIKMRKFSKWLYFKAVQWKEKGKKHSIRYQFAETYLENMAWKIYLERLEDTFYPGEPVSSTTEGELKKYLWKKESKIFNNKIRKIVKEEGLKVETISIS